MQIIKAKLLLQLGFVCAYYLHIVVQVLQIGHPAFQALGAEVAEGFFVAGIGFGMIFFHPAQGLFRAAIGLLQDIAEYLRDEAEKKQVSISVSGYPVFVLGVGKILDEMIYNLCDNAIKYNRPGGSVWIELSMQNKKILLTVRDNGIGIPEEHQSRIFERFYRVDKSHSREIGGTGLGLSIVKHGAIFHNAELLLESTPGEGTSVTIAFDPM